MLRVVHRKIESCKFLLGRRIRAIPVFFAYVRAVLVNTPQITGKFASQRGFGKIQARRGIPMRLCVARRSHTQVIFWFLVVVPRSNINNKKARTPSQHHRITLTTWIPAKTSEQRTATAIHIFQPTITVASRSSSLIRTTPRDDEQRAIQANRYVILGHRAPFVRFLRSPLSWFPPVADAHVLAWLLGCLLHGAPLCLNTHTHTYIITSASLSLLVTYVPTLVRAVV